MKKETIEYFRQNGSIFGYEYVTPPKQLSESNVLNFLCKWSKNKNVEIYSHSLRREYENIGPKVYKYFRYGGEISKETYKIMKKKDKNSVYFVPYCDTVFYLDIYYQ